MRVTQFIPRQWPGVKDQCLHYYTIEVLSAVCNCMRKLSSSLHTCVSSRVTHKPPRHCSQSHSWVSVQHFYYCLFVFWGIKYYPFWTTTFSHPYDKGFLHKLSDTYYYLLIMLYLVFSHLYQGLLSYKKCIYIWYSPVYIQKELGSFVSLNHDIYIAADRIPVDIGFQAYPFRGL